jgi:large subunit ribosomal protein L35Ae
MYFIQILIWHAIISIVCIRRGRRNTYHHTNLLKLDGVNDKKSSEFYFGKKVAFIYKASTPKNGSKFRVVWGKVTRAHGSNGVVRAKFSTNLCVSLILALLSLLFPHFFSQPTSIGSSCRVMLYPSRV